VSEENGRIRIAENGELSPPIARDRFAAELAKRLSVVKDPPPSSVSEEAD
jgi:hypothetical protein